MNSNFKIGDKVLLSDEKYIGSRVRYITFGKIYDVLNEYWDEANNHNILIKNDIDINGWYSSFRFVNLSEYRNNVLEYILS